MQLHSIKPGLPGPLSGQAEGFNKFLNIVDAHLFARRWGDSFHDGGTQGRLGGKFRIGLAAGMGHLENNFPPLLMNGLSHLPEPINQRIFIDAYLFGSGLSLGADIGMAGNDQAHLAFG